jgi:hypothetical protein
MEFLFDGLNVRVQKAKKRFLDIAEVKRWKAQQFQPEYQYLERDRNLFLFQIYTGYYYKTAGGSRHTKFILDGKNI